MSTFKTNFKSDKPWPDITTAVHPTFRQIISLPTSNMSLWLRIIVYMICLVTGQFQVTLFQEILLKGGRKMFDHDCWNSKMGQDMQNKSWWYHSFPVICSSSGYFAVCSQWNLFCGKVVTSSSLALALYIYPSHYWDVQGFISWMNMSMKVEGMTQMLKS